MARPAAAGNGALVRPPTNPGLGVRSPGFPSLPPPHLYHQGPRPRSDEPRGDVGGSGTELLGGEAFNLFRVQEVMT